MSDTTANQSMLIPLGLTFRLFFHEEYNLASFEAKVKQLPGETL